MANDRPPWWPDNWDWPPKLDSDVDKSIDAKQQAIDELIAAYVKAFGEQPDNVTGMVIRSSVQRVIDGEPYEWKQEGQWRRLVWL